MNDEFYRKANIINCDPIYKSKVQFMTLGEIKKLHDDNGMNSNNLILDQDTLISTLKIINQTN